MYDKALIIQGFVVSEGYDFHLPISGSFPHLFNDFRNPTYPVVTPLQVLLPDPGVKTYFPCLLDRQLSAKSGHWTAGP